MRIAATAVVTRPVPTPWTHRRQLMGLGANYVHTHLWSSFAIRDGNLITSQLNYSGTETARLVIEALGR
jgi:putative intracellular protease/amidase